MLDESGVVALLALDDSEIARLVPAFEALTENPIARPDSYCLDRHGRPLQNKIAGNFLIGYWPEHATRTVHILRIDPLWPLGSD